MGGVRKKIIFARELWKNRIVIRNLLGSENIAFLQGFGPGHFYSRDVRQESREIFNRSAKSLAGVELNEAGQLQLLSEFAKTYSDVAFPTQTDGKHRYYFDNPFFSYGDAVVLHSMLRRYSPKSVIEVGSGFSSAAMLDTNDSFFGGNIHFTFVEPFPERLHSLLSESDRNQCRIEANTAQRVDPSRFRQLEENDILFIDSSHVGKIGSDVLHLIFNILPLLKKGVIIHFHDVLWPFEYPETWLEQGKAWNEAYYLRAFLQYNSAFEIVYFNSFMEIHHRPAVQRLMPKALKTPSRPETMGNSSLWLRKKR